MNWILTIIFIIVLLLFYKMLGKVLLKTFQYEKGTDSKEIIAGFIGVTFCQWIIGCIFQVLHLPWSGYFWIMVVVMALLFAFSVKENIKDKSKLKQAISKHMKNYWFIYLVAIVFTIFSITNLLAYFEMNYDDSYYLAAMVQNIGTDHLASVNYFNGSPIDFPLARIFNTYEIDYAFWGTLFHIDITFFARCTMDLHNYIIAFLAVHALMSCWYKDERYTQFAVAAYSVLLIPAGYFIQRGYLKMYDSWQFNTAMWYGGSIVRMVAVPALLTFSIDLFKKINFRKIAFLGIIICSMLAFSSITITYSILYATVILTVYCFYQAWSNRKSKKKLILWLGIVLIGWIALLIFSQLFGKVYIGSGKDISYSYATYLDQRKFMFASNKILFLALAASIVGLFVFKDRKYAIVMLFGGIILILFKFKIFDYLILISSLDISFSALRMLTSIQMLFLICAGYTAMRITKRLFAYRTYSLLVFSFLALITIYNVDHLDDYLRYTQRGGGLSKYGFSVEKVIQNKYLSPAVFTEIGEYMNTLPTGKYRVVAPYSVPYEEGTVLFYTGLNYSSHNVEVCTSDREGCDNIKIDEKNFLVQFASGNVTRERVDKLLKKYNIQYVVTNREDTMEQMKTENCKLELTSTSLTDQKFYLLKIN